MWNELLNQALCTARKITRDPEAESIAGEATVVAQRSFDPTKGVTIEQWVSYVTRQRIWGYWRKQKTRKCVEYKADVEVSCTDDDYSEVHPDFMILVERFVDGVAEWSLARKYGVTTYVMRQRIAAAKARFLEAMGA